MPWLYGQSFTPEGSQHHFPLSPAYFLIDGACSSLDHTVYKLFQLLHRQRNKSTMEPLAAGGLLLVFRDIILGKNRRLASRKERISEAIMKQDYSKTKATLEHG